MRLDAPIGGFVGTVAEVASECESLDADKQLRKTDMTGHAGDHDGRSERPRSWLPGGVVVMSCKHSRRSIHASPFEWCRSPEGRS